MRSRSRWSGVALCAVLFGVAGQPAWADVVWDPASLQELYAPSGQAQGGEFYAYAPSVISDGADTDLWTCHNTQSGVIRDSIQYTRFTSGSMVTDQPVLSGSGSGWDSFHNCDPSVLRVNVAFGANTYTYAMFYLGNDLDASAHNQVGVAFANSLAGPWTRDPAPLIAFAGRETSQWGAGQPSATTIDPNAGTVLLFWTEGYASTTTYRAEVDFSNPAGPVVGTKIPVTTTGLTGTDGSPDWLNNADLAYDPSRDLFWAIREQHPYPADDPDYLSTSVQLVSIPGSSIWNGGGTWTVQGAITPAISGFARNDNAGLVRTAYGTLADENSISVVFTTSCGGCANSLWTYALWQLSAPIPG